MRMLSWISLYDSIRLLRKSHLSCRPSASTTSLSKSSEVPFSLVGSAITVTLQSLRKSNQHGISLWDTEARVANLSTPLKIFQPRAYWRSAPIKIVGPDLGL